MGLQKDGIYNFYDGRLRITNEDREPLKTFDVSDYDTFITDNVINTLDLTLSSSQERERNLLVGPLARYHVINEYGVYEVHEILKDFLKWDKNILFSNVLRLIEILVCLFKGLLILDNAEITKEQPVFVPLLNIKIDNTFSNEEMRVFSAVESSRGTLIHYYRVNEELMIDDAKIHVPIELNTFSIHAILNRICKEEFDKSKSLDLIQEIAKFVVRSFDPCISCSSVAHHKSYRS